MLLSTLDDLVAAVGEAPPDGRRLVAIAGAPASGKSTVAEALVERLNGDGSRSRAAVVAMDGFHYDDAVLAERGWRGRKGAPHTFDVAGLSSTLARLRRNDEPDVAVPVFDRAMELARAGARLIPQAVDVVVVEGNYLLLDADPWRALATHFDQTVCLEVAESEIRRRLEARWAHLEPDRRDRQIERNDLPNARLVTTSSLRADITVALGPA